MLKRVGVSLTPPSHAIESTFTGRWEFLRSATVFFPPVPTNLTMPRRVTSGMPTATYRLKKNQNAPRPSEHPPIRGEKMSKRLGGIKGCKYKTSCFKKNQTTPRPSEHPPVMGEKMSKRLGGIKRLQIQNLFMAFKQVPRCR